MNPYDAAEIAYQNGYEAGKRDYEEVVYKLECLLCYVTGNRLSKHTYDLETMKAAADDYTTELIDQDRRKI